MWYQSSFLSSQTRLCCGGFESVFIDQVYLGFVIILGLVGDFAVVIQVQKQELRDFIESRQRSSTVKTLSYGISGWKTFLQTKNNGSLWILVHILLVRSLLEHSLLVHNLLVHKLLVHNLLVCRRKFGRSWIEYKGVLFKYAQKIQYFLIFQENLQPRKYGISQGICINQSPS